MLALDDVVGVRPRHPAQVFGAARDADRRRALRGPASAPRTARAGPHDRRLPVLPDHGLGAARHRRHGDRARHPRRPPVTDGTLDPEVAAALRAAHAARRAGSCRSAPARSCWPPPGCSTAGRPPPTGRTPTGSARCYPEVRLDPDVLFVDDGDVLTSAGVAAGIDLCLHVVRRDHGSEVANRAARRCVVPPWRDGGQAQFIERPVPGAGGHHAPAPTRAWALAPAGRAARPAGDGRAGADERAHLHPAVPRGDRA